MINPYKLAGRETKPKNTVVTCKNVAIGGNTVVVMAGPCSVESEEQIEAAARAIKKAGATILRGGAFKPRTTPYAFQGLGRDAVMFLERAGAHHGLVTVSEVMDVRDIDFMSAHIDILQIGARNMQNFALLKEVGRSKKPVLLKRGLSATINEFLLAAEYLLAEGNEEVILCERGIRTFEDETRNTICIATVPIVKKLSHLPIIIDPSHGTGKAHLVPAMTYAAIAAGADGVMVEVHPDPVAALSDGEQALAPSDFAKLMVQAEKIARAIGRKI